MTVSYEIWSLYQRKNNSFLLMLDFLNCFACAKVYRVLVYDSKQSIVDEIGSFPGKEELSFANIEKFQKRFANRKNIYPSIDFTLPLASQGSHGMYCSIGIGSKSNFNDVDFSTNVNVDLEFYSVDTHMKNHDYLFESCINLIKATGPEVLISGIDAEPPFSYDILYLKDPYYFCIDLDNRDEFSEKDKEIIKKAKKVISNEEIVSLVEKYWPKIITFENKGIALDSQHLNWNEFKDEKGQLVKEKLRAVDLIYSGVFPFYFIRKELCKRGVQIEESKIEENARELGIG